MLSTAKVEIYNICEGSAAVGNGYMVARYIDGRRAGTLRRFGRDEAAARRYAELWNGPESAR